MIPRFPIRPARPAPGRATRPGARLLLVVAAVAGLAAPSPAPAAPEAPCYLVTPLAGVARFDGTFGPERSRLPEPAGAAYLGARAAKMFSNAWGVQVAGGFVPTEVDATGEGFDLGHLALEAVWAPVRFDRVTAFVTAGPGYLRVMPDDSPRSVYGLIETALGADVWFTDAVGLRLEARDWMTLKEPKDIMLDNAGTFLLSAGITVALGGTPRDEDGDGIPDQDDTCPGTPRGVVVGSGGCPIDSDADGAWDGLDACPDTPRGAIVDARGCPKDTDSDGVPDGLDTCPDTPKGARVDAAGCPSDADSDGVLDGLDACPGTPTGARVDARGCPSDADGDGVLDGLDRCEGTATGLKVDAEGCPIEVTERETELLDTGMIRLENVRFETGKSDVLPEFEPVLREVGQVLLKWPELEVEIGGHTDSRGSDAANQALSEARAASVREFLVREFPGLRQGQLVPRGYGESKPLVPNRTPADMARNRRVEFVVLNRDVLRREVERRRMLRKEDGR